MATVKVPNFILFARARQLSQREVSLLPEEVIAACWPKLWLQLEEPFWLEETSHHPLES